MLSATTVTRWGTLQKTAEYPEGKENHSRKRKRKFRLQKKKRKKNLHST